MKKLITAILLSSSLGMQGQDPWLISVDNPHKSEYFGVTVANGQTGVFSSARPLKVERIILGGLYDIYGRGRVSNFVHGINMLDMEMKLDGATVGRGNIDNFRQTLDMRNAEFRSEFDVPGKARVEQRTMALRQLPFCVLTEVTVTPERDMTMNVENIVSADESLKNPMEYFGEVKNPPYTYNICTTVAQTPTRGILTGASSIIMPDESYPLPKIGHASTRDYNNHSQNFAVELKKGHPYTFHIIGATLSEATHHDIRNAVERLAFVAAVETPGRLIKRHRDLWDDLWESDIIIEGDAQSQQDVHNMIYHMYSFIRENSGLSMSPMGLSGFGYNGHIFWDAETWVYPALLMLRPELAKSMLDYRYDRLAEAKTNAYTYGYEGALYPWESSGLGNEDTPAHNLYGALEVHISADIAIAAWQYFQVTGDRDWLAERGWPIIKETADFWTSRVEPNDRGGYSLVNVIGADEWNVNPGGGKNVIDNAYTIGAAKTNLGIAEKAAKILGKTANPDWVKVNDGLELLKMDDVAPGLIREHSTYRGEKTKQADVSLLAYPLGILTDTEQIRSNLEYYLATVPRKRTPAMSKSVYSILYSRLGRPDKAWEYFVDSYVPNLNPPFRVIAEFDGGTNPYFITGAGGTLQSVIMGVGGLRFTDKGIVGDKRAVPSQWTGLTIKGVGPQRKNFKIK